MGLCYKVIEIRFFINCSEDGLRESGCQRVMERIMEAPD